MLEHGEKAFRAKQVYEWLWKKSCHDFNEMSNLSQATRTLLQDHFELKSLVVADEQVSKDRTIKCAFEVAPGQVMEGVLIPTTNRITACVSSQVGCSLACKFCATGRLKLLKNLSPGEIYDQVAYLSNKAEDSYGLSLSNIVFMGMGEPLLNYKNVLQGIHFICSEEGLNISPKRITVSTAGIAKMIRKLLQFSDNFILGED